MFDIQLKICNSSKQKTSRLFCLQHPQRLLKISSLKLSQLSSYSQIKLFVFKLICRTFLSTFMQKFPSEFLVEQRAKRIEQQAKRNEQRAKHFTSVSRVLLYLFKSKSLVSISPFEFVNLKKLTLHNHINCLNLSKKYVLILVSDHKIVNIYYWLDYIFQKYKQLYLSYLSEQIYVCIWNKFKFNFCYIKHGIT